VAVRQALALAVLAFSLPPARAAAQVERFALVVGNDVGQAPDVPLRYAEVDATRVAEALQEVGGVRPENVVLLRGQDADTARRALIAVNDRVRAAGRQAVLLVYYSGHADAGALHLGRTSLELIELEQLVRGSAASFRLLVLDACRSGALTRVKGGTPIPAFDIGVERMAGEGAVFLTSSSASEDSQESDELKGSFFTHALLSGLLGAADENGDGRVTLDEAYRYAYGATLRASSRTLAGIQHPTFQYDLRGQGDLVLATLRASSSRGWVEFPGGRAWLLIQGSQEGAVVGEVGAADGVRRLNVRAGRYFVRGRGPDALLEGTLEVPAGDVLTVDPSRLSRTAYARLLRKGEGEAGVVVSLESEARFRTSLANDGRLCPGVAAGLSLALRSVTLTPRLAWCRSGFEQTGLTATVDQFDLELSAVHVWDLRAFSLDVGLTAGGALFHQGFRTGGLAPPRTTAALQLSPSIAMTRELPGRTYLYLSVVGATYLFRSQSTATGESSFGPSFAPRVALGAGFRL
jgi:uncharacterized caspase-like protein